MMGFPIEFVCRERGFNFSKYSDHDGISNRMTCFYRKRIQFFQNVICCDVHGMDDGYRNVTHEASVSHDVKAALSQTNWLLSRAA